MKEAGADWLHYDVMDGAFVPNISFGQGILKAAAGAELLPCDVHLMIERPERYIEEFAAAGAKVITVHAEATNHLNRVLHQIRDCGCLAGVALNPATSPECLRYVLGEDAFFAVGAQLNMTDADALEGETGEVTLAMG